jgi:hypothetical protein
MRMIVVEGPDGAGKTTLVERLCKRYGLEVGVRQETNREEIWRSTVPDTFEALTEAIRAERPLPRIWDRLFYSEFVYARLVGRPNQFRNDMGDHIRSLITWLEPPVIFCCPPMETVVANATAVDQMNGVKENLIEIYRAYVELFHFDSLTYDYTSGVGLREAYDSIELYLEDWRKRTW